MRITKADGTRESFDPHKLTRSLERSGVEREVAQSVLREIETELYDGITTQEIYRRAFARLRTHKRPAAARYSLKRAVLEFGPSGFPFEAYLAELFRAEGYETGIDRIISGICVEHEVDVVLKKGATSTYVEAKFHNAAGFKTDLKTVLYVQARVEDIAAAARGRGDSSAVAGMVVTNTKFTSHAVQYSACAGLELLSWEQPRGRTLHDRIEAQGLYPVTALTTLSRREKLDLLSQRVVLCSALPRDTRALASAGVSGKKADHVLEEAASLCAPGSLVQ